MPINNNQDEWIDVPETDSLSAEEVGYGKNAYEKITPDDAGKAFEISQKKQVPFEAVAENKDEWVDVDENEQIAEHLKAYPKTAQFVKDPVNMALAKDHIKDLTDVEDVLGNAIKTNNDNSFAKKMWNSLGYGLDTINASIARTPALLYSLHFYPHNVMLKAMGKGEYQTTAPDWLLNNPIATMYDKRAENFKSKVPELEKSIFDDIQNGNLSQAGKTLLMQLVANSPTSVALIAATLSGVGTPALFGMGGVSAAGSLKENVDAGFDPATATANAGLKGVWEGLTERINMGLFSYWQGAIARSFGKATAMQVFFDMIKALMSSFVVEGGEEYINTNASALTDVITGTYTMPDDVNEIISDAINVQKEGINSFLVGGFSGMTMTAPSAILGGMASVKQKQMVDKRVEFYEALGDKVKASKLSQRSTGKTKEMLDNVVSGTPYEHIYLDGEKVVEILNQEGINPDEFFQGLGATAAYEESKKTNMPIKISMSEWTAKIAPTDMYGKFKMDFTYDGDSLTARQQQEIMENFESARKAYIDSPKSKTDLETATSKRIENLKNVQRPEGMDDKVWKNFEDSIQKTAEIWAKRDVTEAFMLGMTLDEYYASQPETIIRSENQGTTIEKERDILSDALMRLDMSEAGYRMPIKDEQGYITDWVGAKSTFPDWFKDKGWSKSEIVDLIHRYLRYEKLTEKQLEKIQIILEEQPAESEKMGLKQTSLSGLNVQLNTKSEAFKIWFGDSKVVDESGNPKRAFHGTKRPDRVGGKFSAKRATSGAMAYFTDDPEIASGYAQGKQDTSLQNEDVWTYENWYRLKVKGIKNAVSFDRAWYFLDSETKNKILQNAPKISQDDNGNILIDEKATRGNGGYDIEYHRGNALKALVDAWLNSGALFDEEKTFKEVLKLAGMDLNSIEYHDPNAEFPSVYPVYLSLQNPLITNNIPESIINELESVANRKRSKPKKHGADIWDKNMRDAKEWVSQLKEDAAKGENSFVWTSIPDWVTEVLKENGYDGIIDRGGKSGGTTHEVYIPFYPTQIKSVNNRGTFSLTDAHILNQDSMSREGFPSLDSLHDVVGSFSKFVDGWKQNKHRKVEAFKFNNIPQIFKLLGFKPINIIINDGVLRKATTGTHDVDIDDLKKIPESLSRPVAIFDSKTVKNALVFVTEIIDKSGRKVIASIEMSKTKRGWDVGQITNAYGKDSSNIFIGWMNNGLLRYVDTKKAQNLLRVGSALIAESQSNKLSLNKVYTDKDLSQGLFQDNGENPNANIKFTKNADIITLFKGVDRTSVLHELSHKWLKDMQMYVNSEMATEAYYKDWSIIKDWLGIKEDFSPITREQQEKFARGFEVYLFEGKAPTSKLKRVFRKVSKWFRKVYKRVSVLGVKISPEIRGVFDRMLATEEEIRRAEAQRDGKDWKQGIELDGKEAITPEVEKLLNKMDSLQEQAHDEAYEMLLNKKMAEISDERRKLLKAREVELKREAQENIEEDRDDYLLNVVRLNFPKANVKDIALKILSGDKGVLSEKEITQFSVVSDILNYSDPEILAKDVLKAKTRSEKIADYVNSELSKLQNPTDEESIRAEADEAVRSDMASEVLAIEAELYEKLMSGKGKTPVANQIRKAVAKYAVDVAKQMSKEILYAKTPSEAIKYSVYKTSERDLAVKAALAVKNKDYKKAQQYKTQQLLSRELFRESLRLRSLVAKVNEKLLDIGKSTTKLPKSGKLRITAEANILINRILSQYGYAEPLQESGTTRISLAEYISQLGENGDSVYVADWIMEGQYIRNMTVGHLLELRDTVVSIRTAGVREKTLSTGEMLDEVVADLTKEINENLKDVNFYDPARTPLWKNLSRGYLNSTLNLTWITRMLDKFSFGKISKFVMTRLRNARVKERNLSKTISDKLEALWKKHYGVGNIFENYWASHERMNKRYFTENVLFKSIPDFQRGITKEMAIMLALYQGTEENKNRVLDCYAVQVIDPVTGDRTWTNTLKQEDIDDILGEILDKNDWEYVQGVWDLNESMWSQIAELEERRTGLAPRKKKVIPVATKYGEYAGGYFHIDYDPRASVKSEAQQEAANLKSVLQSSHITPSTEHGHTKRTYAHVYGRKLLLQFGTIDKHFHSVVRDLSFNEVLRDLDRVFMGLEQPIVAKLGREAYRQIRPALAYIGYEAKPVAHAGDVFWSATRTRATAYYLMVRITSVLSQFCGVFPAMEMVGTANYLKATLAMTMNPSTINMVWEKSKLMKDRVETRDRDVRDAMEKLNKKNPLSDAQRFGFTLQGAMDVLVAIPQWIAAYENEKNRQMKETGTFNEDEAVTVADEMIAATQGSGDPIDYNSWQRGSELQKMVSMFMTPFVPVANKQIELGVMLKNSGINVGTASELAGYFLFWIVFPAVLDGIIRGTMPNPDEGDDEEDWTRWLVEQVTSQFFGGRPIVRDMVQYVVGERSRNYRISPIVSSFEQILRPAKDALNIALKTIGGESPDTDKLTKDTLKAGTFLIGIPKQVEIATEHLINVMNGDEDFNPALLINPEKRR